MVGGQKKQLIFTDSNKGGIIHVANIKGGVGKSTVATNLAAAFSKKGPTLLIDLDVQGSATVALGKDTTSVKNSSWLLFKKRFIFDNLNPEKIEFSFLSLKNKLKSLESFIAPQIVGKGNIQEIIIKIQPCLDLIPANSDLFKPVYFYHIQNLLYNIEICRSYYTYIIIDTPSVWNALTKNLFLRSDLNLIPVTLNALATKSLKEYFKNVKKLAQKNPNVRIRILKNEVFGKEDSKMKGKTRTMIENRRYLENLFEQVHIATQSGVSIIPQSVIFDLEIPDSAVIRNAQDLGKTVHEYHQYSPVTKAFDELAKRVQYILNTPTINNTFNLLEYISNMPPFIKRLVACLILFFILTFNLSAINDSAPRPIAPQQLIMPSQELFSHTFLGGESLYKYAKYAICRYRAIVPSAEEVRQYSQEIINVYNLTRLPDEKKIDNIDNIPPNVNIVFYPPSNIINPREKQLVPVYEYFTSMVKDPFAYITGDWCERGTGGGTPHYGIDVAAILGSEIVAPIDGIVVNKDSPSSGRTIGIVKENMILTFSHVDKRFYATGEFVKKGTVIATVGLTGQTTGPHVHIGYGIKSATGDGVNFGRSYYKFTDPKLFFYREQYLANVIK
jgi:cellulose biosynthesis protein BcsQ/murein DD-endopeptidase MepM/ murein hydrolase activator NlpD